MNPFLQSSIKLIARNGLVVTYKSASASAYNPSTGKTEVTYADYMRTAYPKQIKANQFNFPSLIGKDVVLFYIANSSLGFVPKVSDVIVYKSVQYRVTEIIETVAHGEIVLYRLLGVKS